MKKIDKTKNETMRAEYKLSGGVRNPYAARYAKGTNLVLIEPDVFRFFPSEAEVNAALRLLMKVGSKATASRSTVRRKVS